jgi:hypothetical protein
MFHTIGPTDLLHPFPTPHFKRFKVFLFSAVSEYLLLTKYHSGDQVKKTEMGRTCGTYGGEERCIQGFNGET